MDKPDENEKTQRGREFDRRRDTFPFDDTAKLSTGEDAALAALAEGEADEVDEVDRTVVNENAFRPLVKPTVSKNADGFYIVTVDGQTDGAYYSDEATARRVATALVDAASSK